MLYITTRSAQDAFTANRALSENRGPDGGFYVPLRMPTFGNPQIQQLGQQSFSQNVAQIMNLLFGTKLDGWAIEFAIGRYPVKLVPLGGKVTVAQTWHNHTGRFDRLVRGLEKAIRQSDQIQENSSDWLVIAARIAVLFGIFGELLGCGALRSDQKLDIAVPVGDMSLLMAVWYARSWGLPVGTIVCCCNENPSIWNLLHKGELRTDAVAPKSAVAPGDDTVPDNLERLIFATLGLEETKRFCDIWRTGGVYSLDDEQIPQLREGLHVSVVSGKRMASAIVNLYKSTGFLADADIALAHSGLIDYRAAAGESKAALIISEESPVYSLQLLADCMDIPASELKQLLQ